MGEGGGAEEADRRGGGVVPSGSLHLAQLDLGETHRGFPPHLHLFTLLPLFSTPLLASLQYPIISSFFFFFTSRLFFPPPQTLHITSFILSPFLLWLPPPRCQFSFLHSLYLLISSFPSLGHLFHFTYIPSYLFSLPIPSCTDSIHLSSLLPPQ